MGRKIAEAAGAGAAKITGLLEEAGFPFGGVVQEPGEGQAAELGAARATGPGLGGETSGELFIDLE